MKKGDIVRWANAPTAIRATVIDVREDGVVEYVVIHSNTASRPVGSISSLHRDELIQDHMYLLKLASDVEKVSSRIRERKSGPGERVKCRKCGDIIQSMHVHDYRYCSCKAIAIDGGSEYQKLTGNPEDIERLDP